MKKSRSYSFHDKTVRNSSVNGAGNRKIYLPMIVGTYIKLSDIDGKDYFCLLEEFVFGKVYGNI